MATTINNIDKLTDQIFHEGIEKAEKRSKQILDEAEAAKEKILQEADKESDRIITEAIREANRTQKSVENELDLKGKQFLSDLKAEIQNMLSDKILKTSTKEAFADVKFVQSVITEVVKCWNADEDLELILPAELEEKLMGSFARSIREMAPNLSITFDNRVNGGFRIARKSNNYLVSFSEEDFIEIFRSYLSEQANRLLFR